MSVNPVVAINMGAEEIAVVGVLLAALVTPLGIVFRLLLDSKERQLADKDKQLEIERADKLIYKEMAAEGAIIAETAVNQNLIARGKRKIKLMAAVVPEHNSPVTEEQRAAAEMQTTRARLTAAALALNLSARTENSGPGPEAAVEESRPVHAIIDDVVGKAEEIKRDALKIAELSQPTGSVDQPEVGGAVKEEGD